MTNSPVPANSLTPCTFGGNPKVAARMFPSCGIARPGPFFNDLSLGKPTSGGRKSRRRGGRKSRRGGVDTVAALNENPALDAPQDQKPLHNMEEKPVVPVKCPTGCGKKNILHSIFGTGGRKSRRGGRKSRRGAGHCASTKTKTPMYGGRKSRRGGRKSRRGAGHCGAKPKRSTYGGRKSRRGGRKSRR
jgi:hypothetical protein